MFCQKCGNEIKEGELFCRVCGTKATGVGESTAIGEPVQNAPNASAPPAVPNGFKEFVDKQIRETTKFQSAEELLKNSKPWLFAIPCFIIPALLGITGGPLAMLGLGAFFGYALTFIVSGIIRSNYRKKFKGRFAGDIDVEKLIAFLSAYLPQICPYFHEWGYLTRKGKFTTSPEDAEAEAPGAARIFSKFGDSKIMVTFYIKEQETDNGSKETFYFVDALKKGFMLDERAAGFVGHSTLIRTAPVLHAAMEYYVNQYDKGEK